MGIFRYIVQGFGWEVGEQVAREGIDALKERAGEREPDERERARAERERVKQAERERADEKREAARREKEVEARLKALKKKLGR